MPFITEELWQNIVDKMPEDKSSQSIMIAPYPQPDESFKDDVAEEVMASVVEIIRSIRNARTEYKVEQSSKSKPLYMPVIWKRNYRLCFGNPYAGKG